jgi:ABC-2 type transport system permease protein
MLLRTWMIAWKEFVQISRDARTLAIVVVLPVMMLVLYGYAINLDVNHIRLAVYDQDNSRQSRDLVGAFSHSEYFDIVATVRSNAAATDALDDGIAKVALVIPTDYARDLAANRVATVQLLVDGSDSTTASTSVGYAEVIVQQQSARITIGAVQKAGFGNPALQAAPVEARFRYWYNPELRSTNYIVPGLIAVILMMLAALLTSMTVVRERERGTIEQLVVSPVMPSELMVGKLIPYVTIAFFDVLLVIAAGRLLFGVPLKGSPVLVLALSGVFLTAALGIGLLISVLAHNQQTAMTVAFMTTLLPSILLSGFIFPIRAMPQVLQLLTNLIPARHFLVILRGIFLKGIGISLLWQPTLVLVVFGVVMLGLSARRFRKKL